MIMMDQSSVDPILPRPVKSVFGGYIYTAHLRSERCMMVMDQSSIDPILPRPVESVFEDHE